MEYKDHKVYRVHKDRKVRLEQLDHRAHKELVEYKDHKAHKESADLRAHWVLLDQVVRRDFMD